MNIYSQRRKNGVNVMIYTFPSAQLTKKDISNFNAQYPQLTVKKTSVFHDRFIVLDEKRSYHIGASLTDAGKNALQFL